MWAYHSMNVVPRIDVRSLIRHAAGKPVPRVMMPRVRYVQAGPTRWMRAFVMKLMAAPPNPPPANTIPFARPLCLLKYCAGATLTTIKRRLHSFRDERHSWLTRTLSCHMPCAYSHGDSRGDEQASNVVSGETAQSGHHQRTERRVGRFVWLRASE